MTSQVSHLYRNKAANCQLKTHIPESPQTSVASSAGFIYKQVTGPAAKQLDSFCSRASHSNFGHLIMSHWSLLSSQGGEPPISQREVTINQDCSQYLNKQHNMEHIHHQN